MEDPETVWKAAKAAAAAQRFDEAAALLEQGLARGDSPRRLSFLQLRAEVAVRGKDWARAAACGREFLTRAMDESPVRDPALFLNMFLLLARVLNKQEGPAAVAAEYARIRPVLFAVLDDPARPPEAIPHDQFLTALLQAGDSALGKRWQERRHPGLPWLALPMTVSPTRRLAEAASVRVFEPAQHIQVRNDAFTHESVSEPYRLAVIPGGEALCGWDFAVTPAGEVLWDSGAMADSLGWFPSAFNADMGRMLHLWPEQCTHIDADVIFLHGSPRFHVGHWIADFLPRLRAREALPGYKIAIPAELPAKHRDLLALCGVGPDDVVECALGARYRFRTLAVALPGSLYTPSVATSRFLAEHLGPQTPPPRTRRIFLVRSVASRRIANEAEVRRLLDGYGFTFMDLADADIAAQRSAMAEADIAVCTYGSDPIAVLFMQGGADMIEFRYGSDMLALEQLGNCTDTWFNVTGVNYHVMPCAVADAPGAARHKKDRDFVVDCGALAARLDAILARKAAGQAHHAPFDLKADDAIPPDLAPGTARTILAG